MVESYFIPEERFFKNKKPYTECLFRIWLFIPLNERKAERSGLLEKQSGAFPLK